MSNSYIQLTLIPITDAAGHDTVDSQSEIEGVYHPDVPCEGPHCDAIVPAGYTPRKRKHYFCSARCDARFHKEQHKRHEANGQVRKITPTVFRHEGPCEAPGCGKTVPAGYVLRNQQHRFCDYRCDRKFHHYNRNQAIKLSRPAKTERAKPVLHFRDAGLCETPGCNKIVQAAYVLGQQKHRFCDATCMHRFHHRRHVVGTCEQCGGPARGLKSRPRKFCGDDCYQASLIDKSLGQTGPFRQTVEDYLGKATSYGYSPNTVPSVKGSLCRFASFIYTKKHVDRLEDIRPWMITDFIQSERARGVTSGNYIGHISTFFKNWITDQRVEMSTPVQSGIHVQNSPPGDPRPFSTKVCSRLWLVLQGSGDVCLMLAAAIGAECGLRVGEVANIRLSDIDFDKQEIFVRLPTKNKRTRTVPFHDKVKKYLRVWLEQRDASCTHDHLLHSKQRAPFVTGTLDKYFREMFEGTDVAEEFEFHRFRHTWASGLMNNGMELAVLKELGGWVSWNSMQRYIKVLDKTVRDQYMAAYATLQATSAAEQDEMLSFLDYTAIDDLDTGNPAPTAA